MSNIVKYVSNDTRELKEILYQRVIKSCYNPKCPVIDLIKYRANKPKKLKEMSFKY